MAESDKGALALVLHSHMPYVEGFGTWPFGEEWLLEAMASVYLPLISLCDKWANDGRTGVLTLGLTPVLCDQLEAPGLADRFRTYCTDVRIKLSDEQARDFRQKGETEVAEALDRIKQDYLVALDLFESLGGKLLPAFEKLQSQGVVGIWTSAATHAVLPLLATEAGGRLQLDTGVQSHRRRFGGWSGGLWLPECAYSPGIERWLDETGANVFCVDQTGCGERLDSLEAIKTAAGPVAVPVDWPTVELVWGNDGYPAHAEYRDYHIHSMHGMRPYRNGGGAYIAERAVPVVRGHAHDFVTNVVTLLDEYASARSRPGLVTCALDTELLGHWWYEGLSWLEEVVDAAIDADLRLTVLPDGLSDFQTRDRELLSGSWGEDKDLSTWDCPETADLVWAARQAEIELVDVVTNSALENGFGGNVSDRLGEEATLRASRELLALQSSDWCFMESRKLAADYPVKRVHQHKKEFMNAVDQITKNGRANVNQIDGHLRSLAPDIDLGSLFLPSTATLAP